MDLPNPEIPSYATCKMFWLVWNIHPFLGPNIVRHGIEGEDAGYNTSREVSRMSHAAGGGH
jgi:hypothetical protein